MKKEVNVLRARKRNFLLNQKNKNGKSLYDCLRHELKQIRKDESDLIEIIVEYLFDGGNEEIEELVSFLESELKNIRE